MIWALGQVRGDGKPFVKLWAEPPGDLGPWQLSPAEAVAYGTRVIQAAVEAERDAAVVLACIEHTAAAGKSKAEGEVLAADMLSIIRAHRGQVDPDPDQSVPPSSRPDTERGRR